MQIFIPELVANMLTVTDAVALVETLVISFTSFVR